MTQNNSRSLFLYTALIFIVAILLILISFFGDANVAKNSPAPTQTATATKKPESSITEKASALSDENLRLTQETDALKDELKSTQDELKIYTSLSEAYYQKALGNTDAAKEIIASLDFESLDEKQKELYNKVNE